MPLALSRPGPDEASWRDLAGLAPCLPGARLTGSEGDICSGKTKVGPPVVVTQVIYRLVR